MWPDLFGSICRNLVMNGQGSRPGEGERNRKVNPVTWILHRLSVHRMTMRRLTTLEEESTHCSLSSQ